MRQHLEFQLTRPSGYEPPFRLTRYVGLVLARYPHTHSLYTETLLLVPERRQQPADAPEGVAVRNEGPKASSCQTATGTESSNIFTQGLKCRSLRGSIIPASARVEVQHGLNPTGTGCQESCDTGPAHSNGTSRPILHRRETELAGRDTCRVDTHDDDAVAHLVTGRGREVL